MERLGRAGEEHRDSVYAGDFGVLTAVPLASIRTLLDTAMEVARTTIEASRRPDGLFRSYDLLWVEHELFPWFPAVWEVFLNKIGVPYIVDYDDAVFHRYDRHPVVPLRKLYAGKIDAVMGNASLVIAGNRYLASRAAKSGAKRVEILPTVVDISRYTAGGASNRESVTIGWIGSPTTAKYIRVAAPALSEVCNGGNAGFVMIGSAGAPVDGIDTTVLEWSEETEVRDLKKCDIGIMPLPDDPWARGKCGYKLIQYMACGLPVVASRVGVNSEIVDHGKTGFLVTTTQEWAEALRTLRDSPKLRLQMGRAGLECVRKKYILDVTAPKLAAWIRSSII